MRPLVLVVVLASSGCGAAAQIPAALEASRDVLAVAEPCLVAKQAQEYDACPLGPAGDACRADVVARWAPVKSAFQQAHDFWCSVEPSAEGCK